MSNAESRHIAISILLAVLLFGGGALLFFIFFSASGDVSPQLLEVDSGLSVTGSAEDETVSSIPAPTEDGLPADSGEEDAEAKMIALEQEIAVKEIASRMEDDGESKSDSYLEQVAAGRACEFRPRKAGFPGHESRIIPCSVRRNNEICVPVG